MTRIRTIQPGAASGALKEAYGRLEPLFPPEYSQQPGILTQPGLAPDGVVSAHSLLPGVMEPIFTAMAQMMSPDLPLTRRQHEMINTVVSRANRCHY